MCNPIVKELHSHVLIFEDALIGRRSSGLMESKERFYRRTWSHSFIDEEMHSGSVKVARSSLLKTF